ncbi:hypothetical protein D3C76_1008620 [compost metagenome]
MVYREAEDFVLEFVENRLVSKSHSVSDLVTYTFPDLLGFRAAGEHGQKRIAFVARLNNLAKRGNRLRC